MPWQTLFGISIDGVGTYRGFICLLAGLGGLVVSVARLSDWVSDFLYFSAGLVLAGLATGLSAWYLVEVYDAPPLDFGLFQIDGVEPGTGVYVTVAAGIVYLLALTWQAKKYWTRQP